MSAELAKRRREFFEPTIPKKTLNLLDLPTEIIEEIFYFLPAKTICKDVHLTCQRLYNTSRTPAFWSSYLKVNSTLKASFNWVLFRSVRSSSQSQAVLSTLSRGKEPLHSNTKSKGGK
jgi:hypothetical protein